MVDIFRVTIGGALVTNETWSVNPHFGALPGGVSTDPTELNAAAAAIGAINPGTVLREMLSTAANINRIRVEARDLDGTMTDVGEYSLTSPIVGTSSPNMPPQTSACVSLRTPFAGASNRGRLYWPHLQGALNPATARISTGQAQFIAAAMASYLEDVAEAMLANIAMLDSAPLVVYSPTKETRLGVTLLQCGDVLDTQRRRRDSLAETYGQSVYPPV